MIRVQVFAFEPPLQVEGRLELWGEGRKVYGRTVRSVSSQLERMLLQLLGAAKLATAGKESENQ